MMQAALSDASKACGTSEFPQKYWRSCGGLPSAGVVTDVVGVREKMCVTNKHL